MTQGVIYIRVSDPQQIEGTSLDHQEAVCRRYCQDHSIAVAKVFREEGESAKSTDRAELLRALEFCRRRRRITVFVVFKCDRFARFSEDHFAIRRLLHKAGTKLRSATEPIGDRPEEKLIETVLAGTAEYDNALRRQRSIDGMSAKINQGLWPWRAPAGYLGTSAKKHGQKKTAPDEPDPTLFPIIQAGLKEFAQGLLTQKKLAQRLDELGLAAARGKKTYKQFAAKLLAPTRLKYYAGILANPFTGQDVPALHTPMITEDELRKIQLILAGKTHAPQRVKYNPHFPLRRTVLCASCEAPLAGSAPRGKGGVYHYYHCYNRSCARYARHFPRNQVACAFAVHMNSLLPQRQNLDVFKRQIAHLWERSKSSVHRKRERYTRRLAALEARRERIYEMREDGAYSREEFQERRQLVEVQIAEVQVALARESDGLSHLGCLLESAVCYLKRLGTCWSLLGPELRHQLQQLLFPKGLAYEPDGRFRTPKKSYVFWLIEQFVAAKSTLVNHRSPRSNMVDCQKRIASIDWEMLIEELEQWDALRRKTEKELEESEAHF